MGRRISKVNKISLSGKIAVKATLCLESGRPGFKFYSDNYLPCDLGQVPLNLFPML